MKTQTLFQKVDSYMSALCIGAAAVVSFWFVVIAIILGFVAGPQEHVNYSSFPGAQKIVSTSSFDVGSRG